MKVGLESWGLLVRPTPRYPISHLESTNRQEGNDREKVQVLEVDQRACERAARLLECQSPRRKNCETDEAHRGNSETKGSEPWDCPRSPAKS